MLPTYLYLIVNEYANNSRLHKVIPSISDTECIFSGDSSNWMKYESINRVTLKFVDMPDMPDRIKYLELVNMGITHLPSKLISLSARHSFIEPTTVYPPTLIRMWILYYNNFIVIPALPSMLKFLHIAHVNSLPAIFPDSITELILYNIDETSILPPFPRSLKKLECVLMGLNSLPDLPVGLIILTVSGTNITCLPTLPITLEILDCTSNKILTLPLLPLSLKMLRCNGNSIQKLPTLHDGLEVIASSRNAVHRAVIVELMSRESFIP